MIPLIDSVVHDSLRPVQPLILHTKNPHLRRILFIRGTGHATPDHAVTRDTERTAEPKENGVQRGYPGHALVRLNQPICQSVRSGTVPMLAAGDTFGTQARLSANTRAARPVLLRASHENARRHEVTPRCLTRHEPALSAQSFILHHTGCIGVLTAPTAMRLVHPVVISLFSPMATSNIFTQ